jgi:hypothetical protein
MNISGSNNVLPPQNMGAIERLGNAMAVLEKASHAVDELSNILIGSLPEALSESDKTPCSSQSALDQVETMAMHVHRFADSISRQVNAIQIRV